MEIQYWLRSPTNVRHLAGDEGGEELKPKADGDQVLISGDNQTGISERRGTLIT